jgi:DNA uptake protein ComE-like DNA-binding protein
MIYLLRKEKVLMDRRSYKVNLNRASADELFRGIPGIRRDKIDDIIKNRPFQSWDEMHMIHGLSPEMIRHIKDNAVID